MHQLVVLAFSLLASLGSPAQDVEPPAFKEKAPAVQRCEFSMVLENAEGPQSSGGCRMLQSADHTSFSWAGEIYRGDCRMRDASFAIYTDGSWDWYAQVSSGDTNDTWEVRWNFKDSYGNHLFSIPSEGYYSFSMAEKNTWYTWNWPQRGGASAYPSAYYYSVASVSMSCGC